MSPLRPLDPAFPIERQIAIDAGPVVLVNVFTLDKADEQTFLEAWMDDAVFMKLKPGFISTQLHRAIGESPTYLNYAVWESVADFRAAFTQSGVQGQTLALSVLGRRFPTPVREGGGARHLRRIARRRPQDERPATAASLNLALCRTPQNAMDRRR
jgi:heme-degrading monooxygenase HmoA